MLLLGAGNWTIGTLWGNRYLDDLERRPAPEVSSSSPKGHLLLPPDADRERRDIARAKLEFYQLVQSGGRLMILGGVLCLLGALASFTRERARLAGSFP